MFALVWLSLLILARASEDEDPSPKIQPRIFNGKETGSGSLGGFGVQLFYLKKLICSGTILSTRHILTAAHCFDEGNPQWFHVVAGYTNQYEGHTKTSIKNVLIKIKIHPEYQKVKFIADLAVGKTLLPLKSNRIGYAKVCNSQLYPKEFVTVAGFGIDGRSGLGVRNRLHTMRVPIVERMACERSIGRTLPPNVICAGGYDHRTLCDGDSGGPLLLMEEVCGISSWTYQCGESDKPDVYMSVKFYASFIKETMQQLGY
ncbi:seminase [Drosophila miranda]|uniref:seminase n=1 Tax=Drosophila miranda TaxID=7229 RepID=UPI0007E61480|nr:seminase [Drosophila miranda]